MELSPDGRPIIPLDKIKDLLPQYDEKKELYKLRHYLYYHVIKKKSANEKFEIQQQQNKPKKTNERVSDGDDAV